MKRYRETRRWGCGVIASALLLGMQLGGLSTSRAVDQINAASRRPLPTLAAPPAPRSDLIWVPDRYVPAPGAPHGVRVPGHWEQRLSDQQFYVPPLMICAPGTAVCQTAPAGVKGPVELRQTP
jgi:hypothetical protein